MAASRTPDDDENTGRPEPEPERLILGAVVDELEDEGGGEWKFQWELDGFQPREDGLYLHLIHRRLCLSSSSIPHCAIRGCEPFECLESLPLMQNDSG